MRPHDLDAHLHPAVVTARHLRAVADLWPDLQAALTPAPTTTGARAGSTSASPLPIYTHVHDTIAEITTWARWWARALIDEHPDWTPPPNPWDTPALLRALATRTGAFTEHPNPLIAAAFVDEVHEVRRTADAIAHPTGNRRVPTGMTCLEHDCPGTYRALIPPDSRWTEIPDLTCDHNRAHTITPEELRRLQRWQQRHDTDPDRARAYLAQLRTQQPYRDLARAIADPPPRYNNRARAARRA